MQTARFPLCFVSFVRGDRKKCVSAVKNNWFTHRQIYANIFLCSQPLPSRIIVIFYFWKVFPSFMTFWLNGIPLQRHFGSKLFSTWGVAWHGTELVVIINVQIEVVARRAFLEGFEKKWWKMIWQQKLLRFIDQSTWWLTFPRSDGWARKNTWLVERLFPRPPPDGKISFYKLVDAVVKKCFSSPSLSPGSMRTFRVVKVRCKIYFARRHDLQQKREGKIKKGSRLNVRTKFVCRELNSF